MNCIILADKKQLEQIGCRETLSGEKAEWIRDFPCDNYSVVKVKNSQLSEFLGKDVYNFYDIPKHWLKF